MHLHIAGVSLPLISEWLGHSNEETTLSLESRESNDYRSFGELFLYFSDEMSDITWTQAFQMLLQVFRTMLTESTELSDEKIAELVDAFYEYTSNYAKVTASSRLRSEH